MTAGGPRFSVHVAKEALKFSAAHFIAYRGFRERLHGHNYTVAVTVEGALGNDGYVLDFGLVKQATQRLCAELDERVIVPVHSEALAVVEKDDTVELVCEDDSRFVLPRSDVALVPIAHSSAEELARYLCERLARELERRSRSTLEVVEVGVAEAPGQAATYRVTLGSGRR
jgi:6-pyruvoyltetrahydropterin/6-carboxytetrahydropterin synthase